MKNLNWSERIGFVIILIGFVFMLINDSWENNPIPKITDKNMLLSSIGLLIWALGYMKREASKKNITDIDKKNNTKLLN